jgi:Nucleoside 2-deoxyribosyltransferase
MRPRPAKGATVNDNSKCWICAQPLNQVSVPGEIISVDCPRCGPYTISGSQHASAFPLLDSERYRLSYWNRRRHLEGREPVTLTPYTIEAIVAQLPNPPIHEKPDILLALLSRQRPKAGDYFQLDYARDYPLACASDSREAQYFQKCLIERGDLGSYPPGIIIKAQGWQRVTQLAAQGPASRTAFVAMKFNDEMLPLYVSAFVPAIERAKFEARLANDPDHNEQIDAHIVAELRRCRFVVADVTFASPGVYFEAGYALALGRPVIWTCREDRGKSDMHFDTRQYNHILWKSQEDLADQLYYRIAATI